MTYDSCSLNEYQVSELPTTPEEITATTTGNCDVSGCALISDASTTTTLNASESKSSPKTTTTSCTSATLPSKLDEQQLEWDEIDQLLQVCY